MTEIVSITHQDCGCIITIMRNPDGTLSREIDESRCTWQKEVQAFRQAYTNIEDDAAGDSALAF